MPIPLIRLVAGTAERVRIPFPVATDQLRQLKLDNIGPLDLIPSRFGFTPRPMDGALGYLRDRQRDQVVEPGRPVDARPTGMTRLRSVLGAVIYFLIVVVIALGAAGLVTALDHPPGSSGRSDFSAPNDAEVTARLDAAETDLNALADQVEALGTTARSALCLAERRRPGRRRGRHRAWGPARVGDRRADPPPARGPGGGAVRRHAGRPG